MVSQSTGVGPAAITTADFNNDGILDLAIANYKEGTTSVLLGNGNGAFTEQTTLSNGINAGTIGIVVGDLNKDNQLDLVVVNSNNSNVGVFFGQGNGNFLQQIMYSTGTG
jgi:hypothetical protein